MNVTSVSQTPDQISFSWTGEGSVRILKDGQEVYNGSDHSFTDTGLEPGTMYAYLIKGGQTLKIQTATAVEREEKNEDIPLQELIVTTVIQAENVAVAWEPIRGVKEYEIYRNGDYAGTVTEPAFQDRHVKADESYVYQIKGIRPLELGSEEATEKPSPLAKVIDLLKIKKDEDDMLVETFLIDKDIGRPADHLHDRVSMRPLEYVLRYTTFLEDEWIENPNVLSKMRYFTGDGRSFDPESDRYRTRAEIKVNSREVLLTRDVGASEGYTVNKELVERKAASDEGIAVKNVQTDEEKVSFLLDHSVGNPLMPSPDIIYEVYAAFYPNGVIDISGEHDEAPHHEIYLKHKDEDWKPLHRSETRGLERLAPVTANRFWRYSNVN
ncbi:DUF3238 domain-containing protein [Domibacillus iocasae]|uniref:DUF3238 domain-containing protein n=1 Tax=Domibacillus iocasae TaxID=1714016 RepID=A0A1E7DVD6_9BACI|nr:DUF3238 domain-containing protein [Domibacillus iocasae]OES46648.1 hypothetical protein BA724_00895 [Domibacillus iocasae]